MKIIENLAIKIFHFLICLLCYAGLSPEIYLLTKKKKSPVSFHARNALFLTTYFYGSFLFSNLIVLSIRYYQNHGYDISWPYIQWIDALATIPEVFFYIFLLICLISVITHRPVYLPFVKKIFSSKRFSSFFLICGLLSQSLYIFTGTTLIKANKIVNQSVNPAEVYILYNGNFATPFGISKFPEAIFKIGMYPIIREASIRWGVQSVKVIPLTFINFTEALNNGKLIYLATHGVDGYIYMEDNPFIGIIPKDYEQLEPVEIQEMLQQHDNLQFVYIAACFAGNADPSWEEFFAPAQVISFNRISWVIEHVYWIWVDGPRVIQSLQ